MSKLSIETLTFEGLEKRKRKKRIGRGEAKCGKTCGRGQKGQMSRSGSRRRPGFEGGQMPISRLIGKRGFTNNFSKNYIPVNVNALNIFNDSDEVTPCLLKKMHIISKIGDGIIILGKGELNKKLIVKASRFSKSAIEKITSKGGKTIEVNFDKDCRCMENG